MEFVTRNSPVINHTYGKEDHYRKSAPALLENFWDGMGLWAADEWLRPISWEPSSSVVFGLVMKILNLGWFPIVL